MNSAARCETGMVRKINQDSIFVYNTRYGCLPNIYIVADGMGGHKSGEVASRLAINYFCSYIHENRFKELAPHEILDTLIDATAVSNRLVHSLSCSSANLHGMGTTFVCVSSCENKAYVASIGDSRLYKFRDRSLTQITIDHSYVHEMVKKGQLTKEEAEKHPMKNLVTRSLGTDENVMIDGFSIDFEMGDIILVCSDGLSNMVTDYDIIEILSEYSSLDQKAQDLTDKANSNGGYDNISVILIEH